MGWKDTVRNVAPALGRALGGPGVGTAIAAVSRALLGREDATEAEVAARVANWKPEDELALKKAEQEYTLALVDRVVSLERVEADDRANARKREVDTHDWTPRSIAIAIMVAFFALLALMLTREIPRANERAFDIMLGMLASGVTTVLTYYFGSSNSSRTKDAVLGRLSEKRL